MVEFVARAGQFGRHFNMPYRDLPGPLKNQLGILTAYGIPFDLYLLTAEFNRGKGRQRRVPTDRIRPVRGARAERPA